MTAAFVLFLLAMLVSIFVWVRSEIVCAARIRQAELTDGAADHSDFEQQMLDLTKWTHRQFYPEGLPK